MAAAQGGARTYKNEEKRIDKQLLTVKEWEANCLPVMLYVMSPLGPSSRSVATT